jgi:hypothetical protein
MSLLRVAASWFVEPADDPPEPYRLAGPRTAHRRPARDLEPPLEVVADRRRTVADARVVAPPRIAVIGSGSTAPPLAAAVALGCRSRTRTAAAVVALWRVPGIDGPPPGPTVPALPGAASLAGRLSRRDLTAVGRGRLVWLLLPAACDEAIPVLRHAEAASGDAPVVVALARPREPGVDAVLAERDLAVVAAPPGSPLAAVALEDVADLRIPARACAPLAAGATRLAALAGLAAPTFDAPALRQEAIA